VNATGPNERPAAHLRLLHLTVVLTHAAISGFKVVVASPFVALTFWESDKIALWRDTASQDQFKANPGTSS